MTQQTAAPGPRSLRKHTGETSMFPELQMPGRKRKELTDEEKEERKTKRQEAAAKRAKLQEEADVKRAQERRKRLEKLWESNSYESTNVAMDTDDDDDEDEDKDILGLVGSDDDDEGETSSHAIGYISGDVTHPQKAGEKDAIVVHCVDDSGSWGQGGLFTALSKRSDQPESHYELAGKMKDLALGDAHLVAIDDKDSRDKGCDKVALIVAQHRDRHNNLSGIKLTALSQGLQRVYKAAKTCSGSVHFPRIGYATPGFNWYGTERLIRKHLSSKGIPTYVYYYPRRNRQSTTAGSSSKSPEPQSPGSNTNTNNASQHSPSTQRPYTHGASPQKRIRGLPGFLQGVSVVFHGVEADEVKQLERYVLAYNGDMDSDVSEDTTHIVIGVDTQYDGEDLHESLKIVSSDWLWQCVKQQRLVSDEIYQIT